jgi:methylated-DNA-[protein]-cysteine S-methyltransferase
MSTSFFDVTSMAMQRIMRRFTGAPMPLPTDTVRTARWSSPIGPLLLAGHGTALCGVWFTDQRGIPAWAQTANSDPDHPVLQAAIGQLQAYFAHRRRDFDLAIDGSDGTPFQQRVWHALRSIPYGATVSYGTIARTIGQPSAVRAVGGAIGRNPLGIVLPCHRVVGSDGRLTGYTGGIERKLALLQLEQGG